MDVYEARQKCLSMTEEEKAALNIITCPRCCGTGKYSYCTMYGDTCFKCSGVGFIKKPTKKKKEVNEMEAIYKGYTLYVDYTKKCETTIKELDIKFPSIKDAKDYVDKMMEDKQ